MGRNTTKRSRTYVMRTRMRCKRWRHGLHCTQIKLLGSAAHIDTSCSDHCKHCARCLGVWAVYIKRHLDMLSGFPDCNPLSSPGSTHTCRNCRRDTTRYLVRSHGCDSHLAERPAQDTLGGYQLILAKAEEPARANVARAATVAASAHRDGSGSCLKVRKAVPEIDTRRRHSL